MKTNNVKKIMAGSQPAAKLASSARAQRLLMPVVYQTPGENGEKLVTVDWLSEEKPAEPIRDLYHEGQLDQEFGEWVQSVRPECKKVTYKVLKSLEGEEVDAVTHELAWGRCWIESIHPKGTLLPV